MHRDGVDQKSQSRALGLHEVRALAVLIVIGFYEGASGLSGGFLGLGTNGSITASQLRQLQRVAGQAASSCWSTTFGPQAWEHTVNTALAAAVRHGTHTELANWRQAIAPRPALFWPDGIHPRPRGARLYARVVLAAIKAGPSSRQLPTCPPPTRLTWHLLTTDAVRTASIPLLTAIS